MSFLKKNFKRNAGMTFLELVVVLGIFGTMAGIILFNYHDFSSNVHLRNLAQEIALQIKGAQTEAISGKSPVLSVNEQSDNPTPIGWTPSYGVAFDTQNLPQSFIYYFNSANDPRRDLFDFEGSSYTPGTCGEEVTSECLQEIQITSGDFIDLVCFDYTSLQPDGLCDSGETANRAYISFKRPRGNALIQEADDSDPSHTHGNVFIRITSPGGGHKFISVWESGYISIN